MCGCWRKNRDKSPLVDDVVDKVDEKYVKICGDCRRKKKKQGVNTQMSDHRNAGRFSFPSTLGKNKHASRDISPLEGTVPFNQ